MLAQLFLHFFPDLIEGLFLHHLLEDHLIVLRVLLDLSVVLLEEVEKVERER